MLARLRARFHAATALDVVMLWMYLGTAVWGVWAQIEPPLSLLGASGAVLTRVITLGVLFFAVAAGLGLCMDLLSRTGVSRFDVELPALIGLCGSWLTYVILVWLLIVGQANPHTPPIAGVFGVLASSYLIPFGVRLVTLIAEAIGTIALARRAVRENVAHRGKTP